MNIESAVHMITHRYATFEISGVEASIVSRYKPFKEYLATFPIHLQVDHEFRQIIQMFFLGCLMPLIERSDKIEYQVHSSAELASELLTIKCYNFPTNKKSFELTALLTIIRDRFVMIHDMTAGRFYYRVAVDESYVRFYFRDNF